MPQPRSAPRRRFDATLFALLLVAGCAPAGGIRITPVPADRSLEERVVVRDPGWYAEKIALIDLDGLLVNDQRGGLFGEGEHPVSLLTEKLTAAEQDKDVKAVLLRINSPGGTVTASDLMHQEVQRFKQRSGKPVVAMLMDVAASGGYYVACAADEIIACPTTVTGSIGVIMQMVDVTGTMSMLGVTTDAITSGPRKDSGSPFRKMRPEERESFQKVVDLMYERFVQTVCDGRPQLTPARVRELADGRVYYAPQALECGLIDRIGTLPDAINAAKKRAELERARVVIFDRPLGWRPTYYAAAPRDPASAGVEALGRSIGGLFTSSPVFLYLWSTGR